METGILRRINENDAIEAAKALDSELKAKMGDARALANDRTLQLTNNLLTATTAFMTLLLAFVGSIMESGILLGKEPLFVVIIAAYIVSLVAWLLDYTASIKLLQAYNNKLGKFRKRLRRMRTSQDFYSINNDAMKVAGARSTKKYRIVQSVAFLIGTSALALLLVLCVCGHTSEMRGGKEQPPSVEFIEDGRRARRVR